MVDTQFVNDGNNLALEYRISSGAVERRYVHGTGWDEPLVQYDGTGLTTKRYLHADERGSIVALTDAAGANPAINRYDEFGIPQSTNSGRFGYTGQAWLKEIGLNYYKARMYRPGDGVFLQTDPVGYADGMNLYPYAGNDPVNVTDPTGTFGLFGGCPAGSRCDSTNPAASAAADGYRNARLEFQLEQALPGISQNTLSQAVTCVNTGAPGCAEAVGVAYLWEASISSATTGDTQSLTPVYIEVYPFNRKDFWVGTTQLPANARVVLSVRQLTTRGSVIVNIPYGWVTEVGRSGITFRPAGTTGSYNIIRLQLPNRATPYPYIVFHNANSQAISPFSGRTLSRPEWHYPLTRVRSEVEP